MKLEAGKYYKMRNGKKAYCVGVSLNGDNVIQHVEDGIMYIYKGCKYNVYDSDYDVVSEWVEAKHELWNEIRNWNDELCDNAITSITLNQLLSKYKIEYK